MTNPYAEMGYQAKGWTRIDMLLAAFDGVIGRIEQAQVLLDQGEKVKAQVLLVRAQRIVTELYAGIDVSYGEIPQNMKKMYLMVLQHIGAGDELDLEAALRILRPTRESLGSIRDEAAELENTGKIPPIDVQRRTLEMVKA